MVPAADRRSAWHSLSADCVSLYTLSRSEAATPQAERADTASLTGGLARRRVISIWPMFSAAERPQAQGDTSSTNDRRRRRTPCQLRASPWHFAISWAPRPGLVLGRQSACSRRTSSGSQTRAGAACSSRRGKWWYARDRDVERNGADIRVLGATNSSCAGFASVEAKNARPKMLGYPGHRRI
jgi:hypothetical protein